MAVTFALYNGQEEEETERKRREKRKGAIHYYSGYI
jgi:hypothetical protein